MGVTMILLALGAAGSAEALPLRDAVTVPDRTVRLGDIADLASLPDDLRDAAADAFLIQLGSQSRTVRLTRNFVASRLRAQLPALAGAYAIAAGPDITVTFSPPSKAAALAQCLVALTDISSGDVLKPDDFSAASCDTVSVERAARYDAASNAVIALRPIGKGERIRRFAGHGSTALTAGSTLTFRTRVAGVTIDRPVRALQSAEKGGRLFVRAEDGTVLSANLASDTP